jgi:signal transduction histidine kinase
VQLEAVSIIWEQQPQKAQQMVTKSASMMREGLAETRRALQALRAGSLDNENLVDAITSLADSLMTRYPLQITLQADPIHLQHSAIEHGLYRIVQEAMFNAARHAQAKRITITIQDSPDKLVICVMDDGIGFQAGALPLNGHYGVQGMRERAQHIGAELQIESGQAAGTTVKVTLVHHEQSDPYSDL